MRFLSVLRFSPTFQKQTISWIGPDKLPLGVNVYVWCGVVSHLVYIPTLCLVLLG